MPRQIIYAIVIGGLILLIPLAFAFKGRYAKSPNPPLTLHQDMFVQPRFNAQSATMLFSEDGVNPGPAMRPRVAGTVARGELWNTLDESHYYRGVHFHNTSDGDGKIVEVAEGLPARVVAKTDAEFLKRGKQRYEIFCAPCHSVAGDGVGMVTHYLDRDPVFERGVSWPLPADLTDPELTNSMVGRAAGEFWQNDELPEALPEPQELFESPFYEQRLAELYEAHGVAAGDAIPSTEFADAVRWLYGEARLDSYVYIVIRDGYGTMPPYGSQVFPEDRWAITLYLRALRAAGDERYRELLQRLATSHDAPIHTD